MGSSLILVTGAAGKTGRAILSRLAAGSGRVRAFVRRSDQEATVRALGASEVVVGDLRDPAAVAKAARGVGAVYHICPNMSRDEEAIGAAAIRAARAAGARLVYHSVLLPRAEGMPHHRRKGRVEDAIRSSGVSHTILQPTAYMQNVLQQRTSILEAGVFPVPYAAGSRIVMVDLADVAEAAARVLTEGVHEGATYALCSDELLDQTEIAAALSARLGRRVVIEPVARNAWAAGARRRGLEEETIDDLLRMFEHYERYGMAGDAADLEKLLGRSANRFADFLARELAS